MRTVSFKLAAFLFVLTVTIPVDFAIPANRNFEYKFDNEGKELILHKWGDEFAHGYETLECYTVIFDKLKNRWVYASKGEDGILYPSLFTVGEVDPETLKIEKHIRFSSDVVKARKKLINSKYKNSNTSKRK